MDQISNALTRVSGRLTERSSCPACDLVPDAGTETLVQRYTALIVWRPEGGGDVEAAAVPSPAERAALQHRLDVLRGALVPAGHAAAAARVGAAVSDMLGGGYASLQNVDRKQHVAGYVAALQDLPAWAVERACSAVRKGQVEGLDPDWPPTHARMHQIAERETATVHAERKQIEAVLALRLPQTADEAQRARMALAAQAWLDRSDPKAAELAARAESEDAARRARGLARLEEANRVTFARECAAAGLDPGRGVSPALMARIAQPAEDVAS